MRTFIYILGQPLMLWLLLFINIGGTIWGYLWYGTQLADTPAHFLVFVPDSPTATLFFIFVLFAFILGRNFKLMEALALVTLFKYGIWAVVMNLLLLYVSGDLHWTGYMLIASHAAMAIQGILYAPYFRFSSIHLVIAAVWTLHNDVIDYVFFMYPRYSLDHIIPQIGYFTFWLSLFSIFLAYWLVIRKNRYQLDLP